MEVESARSIATDALEKTTTESNVSGSTSVHSKSDSPRNASPLISISTSTTNPSSKSKNKSACAQTTTPELERYKYCERAMNRLQDTVRHQKCFCWCASQVYRIFVALAMVLVPTTSCFVQQNFASLHFTLSLMNLMLKLALSRCPK